MWIKDPKTKKKSATLTLFTIGFLIACVKLLLSGIVIQGFTFSSFTGGDFASVIGSLGIIYGGRKYMEGKSE